MTAAPEPAVLMEVRGLTKTFPVHQSPLARWQGKPRRAVQALTDVHLRVERGETLGIVGESGCGKSTLARCLVRLYDADSGEVRYEDLDVLSLLKREFDLPVVAYNVSGEYALIKAAALAGFMDERRTVLETLTGMRRAGADAIITYHAMDAARWLQERA